MSKSNALENQILEYLFKNTAIPSLGGTLYFSLHIGSGPGEGGNQATNEISYTNYVRVPVIRTAAGFVVTGNVARPFANVVFPQGGSGASPTATYFGVGKASGGSGDLLYYGTITPQIICGNGVTPQLSTASTITEN